MFLDFDKSLDYDLDLFIFFFLDLMQVATRLGDWFLRH